MKFYLAVGSTFVRAETCTVCCKTQVRENVYSWGKVCGAWDIIQMPPYWFHQYVDSTLLVPRTTSRYVRAVLLFRTLSLSEANKVLSHCVALQFIYTSFFIKANQYDQSLFRYYRTKKNNSKHFCFSYDQWIEIIIWIKSCLFYFRDTLNNESFIMI